MDVLRRAVWGYKLLKAFQASTSSAAWVFASSKICLMACIAATHPVF